MQPRVQLLALAVIAGALVQGSYAYYSGPFLFWGLSELKDLQTPGALAELDDKVLRDLYSNAAAVVIFLRNGTTKLSEDSFPAFKRILDKYEYVYSPQQMLGSNPLDYNVNAEIINLVGAPSQQDVELSALFRDSAENYGERKVLGILANQLEEPHVLQKREAKAREDFSTSTTPGSPTEEPEIADSKYDVPGKVILVVSTPPVLKMLNDSDEVETSYVLSEHTLATYDARERESKLIVTFKVEDSTKLTLKFRFDMDSGYWSMSKVDVFAMDTKSKDGAKSLDTTLELEGKAPYAPLGASYACSRQLVFRNGTTVLTLENIQVQPAMEGKTKFDSAWDCIGFTTAPILSGLFVTTIMLAGLTVAIIAILDIKPPNRFESRTGKQLTFTVQE
uniref:Vacuolar H+ ATPase AC45 accessory subunit n=1 Tax=Anopheles albimanus TaxID=7167 RepID=A0A182FQ40_ANOAL